MENRGSGVPRSAAVAATEAATSLAIRSGSSATSPGQVGDAVAAAEVDLVDEHAGALGELRAQGQHRAGGDLEARTGRGSASRCASGCRAAAARAAPARASSAVHRGAVAVGATRSRGRTSGPRGPSRCTRGRPRARPVVTRTITGAGRSGARASVGDPVDLDERVDDDPADARVERARDLRVRLVVAVQADVARRGRRRAARPRARRPSRCRRAGPPRAPSARPRPTGTPCPRSRRRRPRRSRRTPSRTRAGSRGRARAGRPRRARRRGCRAAAASVADVDARDATRRRRPPGRPRADQGSPGIAAHIRSGAVTPEQAEPVGEHLAGGVVEPQPGAVHVADLLVAERRDPALVVPLVVRRRRAPRGSARRGAARAARRPARRPAGTRRCWPSSTDSLSWSSSDGVEAVLAADARVGRRCGPTLTVRACAYCT